jgi:Domain of unknown function (DUF4124)
MKRLVVVIAAVAFSTGATAQLYKWKDRDGKVRYGDTPPAGAELTRLRAPAPGTPLPAATGEAKNEKALTPEEAFRKRQLERAQAEEKLAKEHGDAETKRGNCEQAQAALRQLQSGQRIATVNAVGERLYMEDDQRAQEAARAQRAVDQWCR